MKVAFERPHRTGGAWSPQPAIGLSHSPPEAVDGLGESEEEVELLSESTAAAAATSAAPAVAVANFLAQLVLPSLVFIVVDENSTPLKGPPPPAPCSAHDVRVSAVAASR